MKEIEFLRVYVDYVDSMINANRMPLNSYEYREQMEKETEEGLNIIIIET